MSAQPVCVVPYDPRWPEVFELQRARVEAALGEQVEALVNIGSTDVPGLDAKPAVDLMVGVRGLRDAGRCIRVLEKLGYEHRGEAGVSGRLFFQTSPPYRCHLHMVVVGGEFWERHLLFRDYLRAHPETAREYAPLKRELAELFRHDREAYTGAKTGFVEEVVERAMAELRA